MKKLGMAGFLFLLAAGLLPVGASAVSAVATDKNLHKLGFCYAKPTLEEAKQCAMNNCKKYGGQNCQIVDTGTKGGYSAIATGDGQGASVLASYEDEEMVSARAVWGCIEKVTGCDYVDIQSGDCKKKSSCKVVAKWHEPEVDGPAQSNNSPKQAMENTTHRDSARDSATPDQAAKALVNQGNALFKEKRFAEALVAYTRAIDADPDSSAAWANRGLTYANMGPANFDAARENFDQAISINPKNDHAYFNRAMLNRQTNQQQAYLDDLNTAAQLGNQMAQQELQKAPAERAALQPANPAARNPASVPPGNPGSSGGIKPIPSGGYETCSIPADRLVVKAGAERPVDAAYNNVCLAVLPPSCRNWTVDRKPCAYRTCMVKPDVRSCPNGEPTSYVAKETLPFTKEDFAVMDGMIAAEAQRRGKVIDPKGQGLNQAQIDAMERQRQLMWNATSPGMVYR